MALAINTARRVLSVDGVIVNLTAKEYDFAELLALSDGVVSREEIMAHLYDPANQPEQKILDVFICKIRRKLKNAGAAGAIETVWGRGYRLDI